MIFIFLILFVFVNSVNATPMVCTMCSVGIASGLGLAKLLGVSETIIGLWSGALILAIGQWSIYFVEKKKEMSLFYKICVLLSSFAIIIPLYLGDRPAIVFNADKICCIDKFLFANMLGALLVFIISLLYQYMKKKNNGHAHFPYEKVILPLFMLITVSFIFYFNHW